MFTIEQHMERLMLNPGMWVKVTKAKDQRNRAVKTLERNQTYEGLISALKVLNVPFEATTRGWCIRTLRK